jgi:hypothetical protein
MKGAVWISNLSIPKIILQRRTPKSPSGAKKYPVTTLCMNRGGLLQRILLLRPHHPDGRMPWRMRKWGWLKKWDPIVHLKASQFPE